jgi:gamma-glutamyltranspeptidase / glutathione hydrolase
MPRPQPAPPPRPAARIAALAFLGLLAASACRSLPPAPPLPPELPRVATPPSFIGRPHEAAIVCAHPLAAETGRAVLAAGGNAADAAIAALLVLNVVEPQASGLGGGGFLTLWSPDGGLEVLDFRESAPAALDPARFFDPADSLGLARSSGGTAVGVPGTPAGLAWLHGRHGRLPRADLVAPAVTLAEDGYPVSATLAGLVMERAELFLGSPGLGGLFLVDGLPPMAGDTLRNPALGDRLRKLAAEGFDSFYRGEVAHSLSRTVREAGGWITAEDLAAYRALERPPLQGDYRGWTFAGPPPPATGPLALMQTLNILEPVALHELGEAERIHLLSEAMKKAMRDRALRSADPAFHPTPLDSLLDKAYARRVLGRIHRDGIHAVWPVLGSPPYLEPAETLPPRDAGNTTHLVVWDAEGMVISLTQSINYFFGAGLAWEGLLLNNTIDDFTWTREESLNAPAPGKRPRSSMAPVLALREGEPLLALGTPGGARIVSAMVQIVVAHLDLGLPLGPAIDAPRVHPLGALLVIEPRLAPDAAAELEAIGYRLHALQPYDLYFGGAHGIRRLDGPAEARGGGGLLPAPRIRLEGGADRRRDGVALKLEAR